MVQFLVEHGCDVNRGDNEGWTPLHATASCGFLSIARYLIEHGANVAAVNNDGDLPIDIAESSEMEEYLSNVLDEQGIDCDEARSEEEHIMLEDAKQMLNSNKYQDRIHPRTGATALHVAAAKGYIKVMNILIQVGADLNAQDNDGWTPLHAAAHWGQKEACAVLADNLANMDIQNFAGQTCFDVAEPELVKLLEELKKKQASMQKDRPEIQAILQRTSNRPPLKRRTSVTRMSGQEKSKSVMKDTKSERAHIENLTLPEEEGEEEKEKRQIEALERVSALKKDVSDKEEKDILPKKVPTYESKPAAVEPSVKEQQPEKIPSWKKVLRRSSENLEDSNIGSEISEVTLKRPKRSNEDSSEKSNGPLETNKDGKPFIPPVRDDESELQRKAHAKRVRETRRSTQGVLLEDIKSAELQYLINTQREAAKRQAEETDMIKQAEEVEALKRQTEEAGTELTEVEGNKKEKQKSASDDSSVCDTPSWKSRKQGPADSKEFDVLSTKVDRPSRIGGKSEEGGKTPDSSDGPSVTLVLRSKSASSPDDTSPSESRTSLGIQAAIQRRRRPKRRSTGVVYLDSDDAQEEKENTNDKDCNSQTETGPAERSRHRYGSSTSIPDTASEASSRSDTPSRYSSISSKSSLNEEENKDYKKLYEEVKKENERLKEQLRKTEEELEGTKKQLQKLSQSNSAKNSLSDAEKKERRSLERKLSEMEEEIKNISKLKAENEKLKAENRALSRVVCKLSK
ncbi:protein phosphatase 1 regulatory subunit 12A-like isoform X4 [Stegodyphus dumicola]|uniref:protein phosphatase 1 regulatory subunit 12A-like isoform X4 n=1 Tax=Stegodyphus dumicola TaxID=202533 RepID=UPI0015AE02C2|nr:protein phosphatase 1 regulatory subunit 12A-like isoform X4 [Stegodyphus dumicola]